MDSLGLIGIIEIMEIAGILEIIRKMITKERGIYGLTREKGIYAHKGKGKSQPAEREKGKGTTVDLLEISLDQAPRARMYARTA